MALQRRLQLPRAVLTEPAGVLQLTKQSLVADALSLQEAQLELLAVAAELSGEAIALALEFFFTDAEGLEVFELAFQLDHLGVAVLVLADHGL